MNSEPIALPHAVPPEKAVLSVILQYPDKINEAPSLTADHFYISKHKILFEIIAERIRAGKDVEFVSLTQSLLDKGKLEAIGGAGYMNEIYTYQPYTGKFQSHLEILKQKLACRMFISFCDKGKEMAFQAPEMAELLEVTSQPITELHDLITGNEKTRSTADILKASWDSFQRRCLGEESPMGIETSLPEINQRFRGIHPKQTIVISAYPGGGKTTLAGQFLMDAAKQERNTLFCSLEMPAESLMQRMVAYVAGISAQAVTDPLGYANEVLGKQSLTKQMMERIGNAHRTLKSLPFHIEDMNGANVYQIAACIRRAHRKNPLDVVAVDFAQRIKPAPEKIRDTREQQLSHASNNLADLSKELGFCLLLPSQLNKEGAAKHAEAINEDADLHLQIMQDSQKNHLGIAVMKDRHNGQDGRLLPIILDGAMLRFIPQPSAS
ncbi:MAG: replicative DNA helicase [Luteolibacter sp.]